MLCGERPGLSGGRCWTRRRGRESGLSHLQAGRSPARRRSPRGRGASIGGVGVGSGQKPARRRSGQSKVPQPPDHFFEEFPRAQDAVLCRGVGPAAEKMLCKTTSIPLKRREFGRFAPDRSRVQDTDPRPPGAGFFFLPIPR